MSDISRLVVAWVSAQQRHYRNTTRGIATVEQRLEWEREAEAIIAAHDREVAARTLRQLERDMATKRYISSHRQEAPIDRMTAYEVLGFITARADQIDGVNGG